MRSSELIQSIFLLLRMRDLLPKRLDENQQNITQYSRTPYKVSRGTKFFIRYFISWFRCIRVQRWMGIEIVTFEVVRYIEVLTGFRYIGVRCNRVLLYDIWMNIAIAMHTHPPDRH